MAYLALLATLTAVVHPLRRKMFFEAEALLADERYDGESKEHIDNLLDTCMSFRVGLRLPLAFVASIMVDLLRLPRPSPPYEDLSYDARYHKVFLLYVASISAANPLALIVWFPLMIIGFSVHLACRGNVRDAVEEPVLTAAALPLRHGALAA